MATHNELQNMVKTQLEARGIKDPLVLKAFRKVPRELFVPKVYEHCAYDDTPVQLAAGQTISQPYIVAYMLQALMLSPQDRVLEVGAGSGYAVALLNEIVAQVYAIERIEELVKLANKNLSAAGCSNCIVKHGDGSLGMESQAPFDAILVSAASPIVPRTLEQQLTIGGRLVIPIGLNKQVQELVRITRDSENEFSRENLTDVRFVPLIGQEGWNAHDIITG
ncbi:MAG: protein-L-isoaspartate(D-aspartate) O-methyltransferase [Gammaproteobacteria bacterium]|nr:protein-L-isoaspartate(D-aspartate) O-methyltransferase [Gammaproteobacteria bacterium]NNC98196.1 protein-L-isoaspartate(D-aspartate) O-methyltransferase [Gammaproteobacteria bacterium]NNM14856.1 protein-L-isoaspartate(D-aspartate) O-methyltransferase [Gammaproteobacteria bacterium]